MTQRFHRLQITTPLTAYYMLGKLRELPKLASMTLTLPDLPVTTSMSEAELRLELACALYARGKTSAVAGAHLAEIDLVSFQGALAEREIPRNYSEEIGRAQV